MSGASACVSWHVSSVSFLVRCLPSSRVYNSVLQVESN